MDSPVADRVNLRCPQCDRTGQPSELRLLLVNSFKGILMCPKDGCAFPFDQGQEVFQRCCIDVTDALSFEVTDDEKDLLSDEDWEHECLASFSRLQKCLKNPVPGRRRKSTAAVKLTHLKDEKHENNKSQSKRRTLRPRKRPKRFDDFVDVFEGDDVANDRIEEDDEEMEEELVARQKCRSVSERPMPVNIVNRKCSEPVNQCQQAVAESHLNAHVPLNDAYHRRFCKRDIRHWSSLAKCGLLRDGASWSERYLWRKLRRRTRFYKTAREVKAAPVSFPFPWGNGPAKTMPPKKNAKPKSIFAHIRQKLVKVSSSAKLAKAEYKTDIEADVPEVVEQPTDSPLILEDLDQLLALDIPDDIMQLTEEGQEDFNLFTDPDFNFDLF